MLLLTAIRIITSGSMAPKLPLVLLGHKRLFVDAIDLFPNIIVVFETVYDTINAIFSAHHKLIVLFLGFICCHFACLL